MLLRILLVITWTIIRTSAEYPVSSYEALKPFPHKHSNGKAWIASGKWQTDGDLKKMPKDIQRTIKLKKFTYVEHMLAELSPEQIEQVAFDLHALGPGGTELILDLVHELTHITQSFYLLHGLHKGMQSKNLLEPYGLMRLATYLQREVIKQSRRDSTIKVNSDLLLENLLKEIIHSAGLYLAEAMLNNKYNNTLLVNKLCEEIISFEPDIRNSIMNVVVDETYDLIPAQLIFDNINTHKEIALRLNGFLALFWKLKNTAHVDDEVVVQITAKIYEIENDEQYRGLSDKELHDIDKLKENLPECLKNLFFEGVVCIFSAAHREYVYAANVSFNYDNKRRSVFSWIPGMPVLGSYWIVDRIGTQVFFKNRDRHMEYLIASDVQYNTELRYVFTWTPGGNTNTRFAWTVQTKENSCYFKNVHYDEYLISSLVTNEGMRNIFTWQIIADGIGDLFAWQILAC